jgi:hypothetical protein
MSANNNQGPSAFYINVLRNGTFNDQTNNKKNAIVKFAIRQFSLGNNKYVKQLNIPAQTIINSLLKNGWESHTSSYNTRRGELVVLPSALNILKNFKIHEKKFDTGIVTLELSHPNIKTFTIKGGRVFLYKNNHLSQLTNGNSSLFNSYMIKKYYKEALAEYLKTHKNTRRDSNYKIKQNRLETAGKLPSSQRSAYH